MPQFEKGQEVLFAPPYVQNSDRFDPMPGAVTSIEDKIHDDGQERYYVDCEDGTSGPRLAYGDHLSPR